MDGSHESESGLTACKKKTFIFTEASKSHKVMDGKGKHADDDPESKIA